MKNNYTKTSSPERTLHQETRLCEIETLLPYICQLMMSVTQDSTGLNILIFLQIGIIHLDYVKTVQSRTYVYAMDLSFLLGNICYLYEYFKYIFINKKTKIILFLHSEKKHILLSIPDNFFIILNEQVVRETHTHTNQVHSVLGGVFSSFLLGQESFPCLFTA